MRLFTMMAIVLAGLAACDKPPAAPPEGEKKAAAAPESAAQPKPGPEAAEGKKLAAEVGVVLTPEEAKIHQMLRWVDGPYPFTVLAWPQRWTDAMKAVSPVLDGFPIPAEVRNRIESASDPIDLLLFVMGGMRTGTSAAKLTQRDLSRPVVAAFGAVDPLYDSPLKHTVQLLSVYKLGVLGISHRVLLPALDAAKLAGEISTLVQEWGIEKSAEADTAAQLKGGALFQLPGDNWMAVIPEADLVRLDFHQAAVWLPDVPGKQRMEEALNRVQFEPKPEPAALSPAAFHVLHGEWTLATLVRPRYVPGFTVQTGVYVVTQALAAADPAERTRLLRMGAAEVLRGSLIMDTQLSLFGEMGFGMRLADPVSLSTVVELTPYGKELLGEATHPHPVPGKLPPKVAAWVASGLDVSQLAAKAKVPAGLQAAEGETATANSVAYGFEECGYGCYLYLATGGWPGALAAYLQIPEAKQQLGSLAPSALWLGLTTDKEPLALELFARFAKGTDLGALMAQFAEWAKLSPGPIDMGPHAREDGNWLLAAWNTAAQVSLLPGEAGSSNTGAADAVWADLQALRTLLVQAQPESAPMVPHMKCLQAHSWLVDGVVVANASIGIRAECPPVTKAPELPRLPPAASTMAPGRWHECEATLAMETMRVMKALSQADAESFPTLLKQWDSQVTKSRNCLDSNPELTEIVGKLKNLLQQQ